MRDLCYHLQRVQRRRREPVAACRAAASKTLCERLSAMQENQEELATLESLDNGKPYAVAKAADLPLVSGPLLAYSSNNAAPHGGDWRSQHAVFFCVQHP